MINLLKTKRNTGSLLLIEDNRTLANMLVIALKELGRAIDYASEGITGMRESRSYRDQWNWLAMEWWPRYGNYSGRSYPIDGASGFGNKVCYLLRAIVLKI